MATIFRLDPSKHMIPQCDELPSATVADKFNWRPGVLRMKDMRTWKNYDVMYANIGGELCMRPSKKYLCGNFESFFGFGLMCEGFSKDKIVCLRGS